MKIKTSLQIYLNQYLNLLIKEIKCCGDIYFKYECCNYSKKWTVYTKDALNVITNKSFLLSNKEIQALDYFARNLSSKCCLDNKQIDVVCCNKKIKYQLN